MQRFLMRPTKTVTSLDTKADSSLCWSEHMFSHVTAHSISAALWTCRNSVNTIFATFVVGWLMPDVLFVRAHRGSTNGFLWILLSVSELFAPIIVSFQ